MRSRSTCAWLCLLVALTSFLPSARVSASGKTDQAPVRLYANEQFGPIGSIYRSLAGSGVVIDGKLIQGDAPLWGGELIKVIGRSTVGLSFESIGKISLLPGTTARFARARGSADEGTHNVLIGSVLSGNATVTLSPVASAYVEAGSSSFSAARGACFTIKVEADRASLLNTTGAVLVQDQPVPQDVNIRLVDDLGRPVSSGSQFSVRARSTRQVQVQVTDKNDKPLPDLPVLFSLSDPCLGALGISAVAGASLVQKTDNRGIAAVPLVAGAAKCAASILAKVEGTNASLTIKANVQASTGFWTTQNTVLVVAGVATAGVVTGLVVANSGGSNSQITPVPPPGVKP